MTHTAAVLDDTRPAGRTALMNQPDRVGVVALVILLLGGLWLMAAPFIVGFQDSAADWSDGTIGAFAFAVGGGVAALALATIVVVVAGVLFDLSRASRDQQGTAGDDAELSR